MIEIAGVIADPESEHKPSARKEVDHGGFFGQMHGIVQGWHDDIRTNLHSFCPCRDCCQKSKGSRKHTLRPRVAFWNKDAIEPRTFCEFCFL
jgi:hypothetical protein